MNSQQFSSSFNKELLATSGPKHGFEFSGLQWFTPLKHDLQSFNSLNSLSISQRSKLKKLFQPFKSSIGISQKSTLLNRRMDAKMVKPVSANLIESSFPSTIPINAALIPSAQWTGKLMYPISSSNKYY